MDTYTIRELETWVDESRVVKWFCLEVGIEVNEKYGNSYNWKKFDIARYIHFNRIVICFRDEEPVGLMMSRLMPSVFDPECKVLYQDLLYAEPGTRAANLLMRDYLDYGKANANHIITMIGTQTNIKGRSLERLGFEKVEDVYLLET
jgi:hypothetical protein